MYFLISGLFGTIAPICLLAAYLTFGRANAPVDHEKLAALSLDFSTLFNSSWETVPEYRLGNEDMLGRNRSIGEHVVVGVHHTSNPLAYIRQHLIVYSSVQTARKKYSEQVDWIFIRNFGVPVSRQIYSYVQLELPSGLVTMADEYEVACLDSGFNVQCGALFLHQNYVIYLDLFTMRNDVEYLTDTELFSIIAAINSRLEQANEDT